MDVGYPTGGDNWITDVSHLGQEGAPFGPGGNPFGPRGPALKVPPTTRSSNYIAGLPIPASREVGGGWAAVPQGMAGAVPGGAGERCRRNGRVNGGRARTPSLLGFVYV